MEGKKEGRKERRQESRGQLLEHKMPENKDKIQVGI